MRPADDRGQALVAVVGALCAVLAGAAVVGGVAHGLGLRGDAQAVADLAALAAAHEMRRGYPRLFEPATLDGRANPRRLSVPAYLALARRAADETARRNGRQALGLVFRRSGEGPPLRVRVSLDAALRVGGRRVGGRILAEAEVAPGAGAAAFAGGGGEYAGPLAMRQGKPMRPDVALAFDRMAAAARADGVALVIASAFRSDREQAALFAAHPDPRWVAPPGRSLHRLGTELDLGPPGAYGWLARNARRFHFVQRYSWEPWHYGFTLNAGSSSVGFGGRGDGRRGGALPAFVPQRYAAAIVRAASRWQVGAALLAAQLHQESGFDASARSPAGALGIAQFVPATARAYGLRNPFDPDAAILAQAHLMHDLLRRFGSVPLALAAYNAGPARVAACGCVPPIAETTAYVAAILARLAGAGDAAGGGGLEVRLVA